MMTNRKRFDNSFRIVLLATPFIFVSAAVLLFLLRDTLNERWAIWSLRRLGYEIKCSSSEFDEPETILGSARYLRIIGDRRFDEVALSLLTRCHKLRTLELGGNTIQPGGLHRLSELPALRTLTVTGAEIDDASLDGIQSLTGIESLTLQGTAIQGEALRNLSSLAEIKDLWLNDNANLREFRSVDLRHLKKVISVNLSRTPIAGDCLAWLPNCKDLCLDGTLIDDETLQGLSRCNRLEKIWLVGTRVHGKALKNLTSLPFLAELNLSECPISDESLRYIPEFRHLRSLTLARTPITDTGLGHLCSATQLKFVGLSYCSHITAVGVARLRGSLISASAKDPREPEVWVSWEEVGGAL